MMHRLRRYDVFRFDQNDVAPVGRNDAMFAQCAVRHTSFAQRTSLGVAVIIGVANIICRRQTSFKKRTFVGRQKCVFVGGGRWIRTTEVSDNRFTVCPLWPLGNSPMLLSFSAERLVELVNGVEPSTCWLQISCSAIEPHQQLRNNVIYYITLI